jgi:hypothetical protein
MITTFDKLNKQANAPQKECGKDMLSPLLGFFP